MTELAVLRGCTAAAESTVASFSDVGWLGMMSIRVHELDGMYDHPSLPMAGDSWRLLELQCHSKLAVKRIQWPKKGSKPDGSDDNGDATSAVDIRSRMADDFSSILYNSVHTLLMNWVEELETRLTFSCSKGRKATRGRKLGRHIPCYFPNTRISSAKKLDCSSPSSGYLVRRSFAYSSSILASRPLQCISSSSGKSSYSPVAQNSDHKTENLQRRY
ncbi:Transcription initiation factor TFIID subunit 2 [Nymphaea thermarum]|nr:Transcription initiation factor TFIID subunit 2 [Nymphaea thermarum]